MFSIRKFFGYTGAAAGICGMLVLAMSTTTGFASAPAARPIDMVVAAHDSQTSTPPAPSAACTAAINALKTWFAGDRTEDQQERLNRAADPTAAAAADPSEDSTEHAARHALFTSLRGACAPAAVKPVSFTKPALTAACTSAIQALKSAWQQGKPATQAQWQQLFSLMKAVRTACGGFGFDRDGDGR